MEVEDVAGEGLTTGRTPQEQRELPVGGSLLAQVIVYDQRMLAAVPEKLTDGAAGIRSDVLKGRGLAGGRGYDDSMIERAVFLEDLHGTRDIRALLTDRDVDAGDVPALLVDDGVNRNGGLSGLTGADDQLTLSAADRDHGVDRLDAGLERLVDRLPLDDARRDDVDYAEFLRVDRPFAVDRLADCVDDPPAECIAHRHRHDPAGTLHHVAFVDK